jgi:hypothetical protein
VWTEVKLGFDAGPGKDLDVACRILFTISVHPAKQQASRRHHHSGCKHHHQHPRG